MNRAVIGFLAGAVLASGIAWWMVRRGTSPPPPASESVQTAAAPIAEQPQTPPQRQPVAPPAPSRPAWRPAPVAANNKSPILPPAPPEATPPQVEQKAPAVAPPAPPEAERKAEIPPPPPPPPQPRTITLAEGTLLSVRINEALSSEKNQADDTFSASLDQPLVVDGMVIAERGARVQGKVLEAVRSGKVKGLAQLKLGLIEFETSDRQKVKIDTTPFERTADSSTKNDAAKVGIGAGIGAAIGAIAGGGKGAAIGAGAGGAAGTGAVLMTRGKPAELPAETKITFRLSKAVTVTEKLK